MKNLPLLFKHEDVDERIKKERNEAIFKAYVIMQVIAIISIPIIIITNISWYNFFAPFIVLVVCNLFLLIELKINSLTLKTLFNKNDECMCEFKNKFFNESFNLGFFIILITTGFITIYFMIFPLHNVQPILNSFIFINLIIILVPEGYSLHVLIKRGLMLSNVNTIKSKNKNANFLRKLKIKCLFGGIFFGIFMGIGALGHTNIKKAIFAGVVCGAFWGILFYIIKRISIKISEKNANKNL